MATMAELARDFTDLDTPTLTHLQRLVGSWGMLADLCFADLLLFVPVDGDVERFIVVGQMRPTTSQTLHREDLVGHIIDESERPLVPSRCEWTAGSWPCSPGNRPFRSAGVRASSNGCTWKSSIASPP